MDQSRAFLVVLGSLILGLGVATMVHIAALGNAGSNKGFPFLGLLAGLGLGLVLVSFLRPSTAGPAHHDGRATEPAERGEPNA